MVASPLGGLLVAVLVGHAVGFGDFPKDSAAPQRESRTIGQATPQKCSDSQAKKACVDAQEVEKGKSMGKSGCRAYANGWAQGTVGCQKCGSTSRAYACCDLAECEALCADLYSGRNLVKHCQRGCAYMDAEASCSPPPTQPSVSRSRRRRRCCLRASAPLAATARCLSTGCARSRHRRRRRRRPRCRPGQVRASFRRARR